MDNVNIMILSKDFESLNICNQVEPWFQTRYEAKGKSFSQFCLLSNPTNLLFQTFRMSGSRSGPR